LLHVERTADGGAEPERGEVVVTWDEDELNELLRSANDDADEVTLWFDAAALDQALTGDVEAHGLRERTALLAIVVAAAGGGAGAAFAADTTYVHSPGVAASQDESATAAGYVHSPGLAASQDESATAAGYVHSPGLAASQATSPTAATASASDAGWSLSAGEGAAIAAGILLITGASFLTARSRRQDLRPT
jgi:hypothetical protein